MSDMAKRFKENPLLKPADLQPSHRNLKIECLLNPGVFRFENKTWLIVRVAESFTDHDSDAINVPVYRNETIEKLSFKKNDPALDCSDPRVISYNKEGFLTTLSHLRLLCSEDGINFKPVSRLPIFGVGNLESYGIEDCKVSVIEDKYYLTYTAVSEFGHGVGMISTSDWLNLTRYGLILPTPNKDCALFEQKIHGKYHCLHRPSGMMLGGNYIWLASSPDLVHWGNHICIAKTRKDRWDCQRIGAGAAPIKTPAGWLEIYHGADNSSRYCLGAMLLDLNDPSKVLARSEDPIMEPIMDYEKKGFFGNVIFTNGHVVNGDIITLYYGASDTVICGATLSISQILKTLRF